MKQANRRVEELLNVEIVSDRSVGGGCVADARALKLSDGRAVFVKSAAGVDFSKEAHGLQELAKPGVIRVPEVYAFEEGLIIMEMLKPGAKPSGFFRDFGKRFAKLHKYSSPEFGFHENNNIGASEQINLAEGKEKESWKDFYFNKRLLFQFKLAERRGYADDEFKKAFAKVEKSIESILQGSEEEPSLLHGDLWSGNYLADENGNACLIDPAVYYGHREADLGMTKLFGGFSADFYKAYNEEYPLKEGYERRENIYILYHVMNHLNIFGRSYYSQALRLMRSYS